MTSTGRTARRALRLMERVLRDGGELADEYPTVFGPRATGEVVAIEEDGDARSACAVLVRELVLPQARVRVGLVGSVATDPRWRGRGLATRVLELAQQRLAQEGCVVAILWADDASFYRMRGWAEFGAEIDFVFGREQASKLPAKHGIRRSAPDDEPAIHRLYSRHRQRVERTLDETRVLLRVRGMETLVIHEDRDVRAYACLGRGKDFADTIHEWGGPIEDVLALVRAHVERGSAETTFLLSPTGAHDLHAAARAAGARELRGILGLGKTLDPAAIAELLSELLRPSVRVHLESENGEPSRIALASSTGRVRLRGADALQILMPARGECARIGELERALDVTLRRLPLEPFVWGLDSI